MRDTFRMDKFAANFNRISSNITDKLLSSTSHISSSSNKPEYHNHHNSSKDSHNTSEDSCREIDPVSPNNSLLQSVAFRAIPCVDIQVSKKKTPIICKIISSSFYVVPIPYARHYKPRLVYFLPHFQRPFPIIRSTLLNLKSMYTNSLVNVDSFYANFTNGAFQKKSHSFLNIL